MCDPRTILLGRLGRKMAGAVSLLLMFCLLMCSGCKHIRIEEEPREEVQYTIVPQEEVPSEIESLIEEKKAETFQITFKSGNDLYLFKGYGQQMTGGYSIQVVELSESENIIYFETKLIGPLDKNVSGEPSYPYIAVKMEYADKVVQFR